MVRFNNINYAIAKLEKEEEETKATINATIGLLSTTKQKLK